jgi:DNA adenine methylase
MAGWGGELNYPRFQTSITDGGGGNRLIGALNTLQDRLKPVYNRLKSVIIECQDWRKCIDRYDKPGAVMYIDPPYPQNRCNYHHNMKTWEEHIELVERLKRSQCKWIYSSYDTEEVRSMFDGHHCIVSVKSASGMNVKKDDNTRVLNKEILVVNFTPPTGVEQSRIKQPEHTQAELF